MKEGKKKKYLVQEFDKDVQGKGIPSWIFLHLSFARLVVGNWNKVFEIIKLHLSKGSNAKQFGREVVFDMVMLSGPKKQANEYESNLGN